MPDCCKSSSTIVDCGHPPSGSSKSNLACPDEADNVRLRLSSLARHTWRRASSADSCASADGRRGRAIMVLCNNSQKYCMNKQYMRRAAICTRRICLFFGNLRGGPPKGRWSSTVAPERHVRRLCGIHESTPKNSPRVARQQVAYRSIDFSVNAILLDVSSCAANTKSTPSAMCPGMRHL
jgi:hypothetical protein